MHSLAYISQRTEIPQKQIQKTLALLHSGASIPFIARYRKEQTGSLNEVDIFAIQKFQSEYTELSNRKEYIIKALEELGVLTKEFEQKIIHCQDLKSLEDWFAPYKKKKKTKADLARENGLEPLALKLMSNAHFDLDSEATRLVCETFADKNEVLEGVRQIVADIIHKDDEIRGRLQGIYFKTALLNSKLIKSKEAAAQKYKDYWDFKEPLSKIPPHRYLAICRAENEKLVRLVIDSDEEYMLGLLHRKYRWHHPVSHARQVEMAVKDALDRLILPLIESRLRSELKDKSDVQSIEVFGKNLRQALLEAPLGQKSVLAIDPGFRTGCKCVCLDASGNLLDYFTIFPVEPVKDEKGSMTRVLAYLGKYNIKTVAIADGTAGKEVKQWLEQYPQTRDFEIYSVDESGASVYSASAIAREEFPDLDLVFRGSVSIGRRLQDPLSELIKIDPKSIGFGQYQHDVNQKWLQERLDFEVSSCVNAVGVQLNTASAYLLSYISGIGLVLAQSIVRFRNENGPFKTKRDLLKISRLGDKVFEQCAGFVRIREGSHPLDNTAVHPERYPLVEKMAKSIGSSLDALIRDASLIEKIPFSNFVDEECSSDTLEDILTEIKKPGIDPRGRLEVFSFDPRIQTIQDLQIGMCLPVMVKNIVQFGIFVDLGIKESGLIHVSEMSHDFVKDPSQVVQLRQKLMAKVIGLDLPAKKIQMSLKL
ncbi:MAG: helix-hairpin-helix domain-containing protein [Saprospiraceae bacterium]|nr:helix-hairpin-helix domain-containing protein [Saprospiraceae bacterium]